MRQILCAALMLILVSAARSQAGDVLADNWSGQPEWLPDASFHPPAIDQHSESAAVFFNGQWLMYHRYGDGIGLSTSEDGDSWTFERVVVPAGLTEFGSQKVYAPKILVLPGLLTMVYEANPAPGTGDCTDSIKQVVAIAHSTDGRTWTDHRVAIRPVDRWEGRYGGKYCGNVGTPTITRGPGGIYIGYHGFNGNDGRPYRFRRGVAVAAVSDPRAITEENLQRLGPMRFTFQDGRGDATTLSYMGIGPGEADVLAADDGSYYMVFEAFAGSPLCDRRNKTLLAIARGASPAGPWAVQDRVLLGQKQGCWRDMPAWERDLVGRYHVVFTDPATRSLRRITLQAHAGGFQLTLNE